MPPSDGDSSFIVDKRQVKRAFERAAERYDNYAQLQYEIGNRMLSRLDYITITPRRILDIGAGTGSITHELSRRFANTPVIALDIAEAMLRRARARQHGLLARLLGKTRYVCGDAEQLPLANDSIDFIFSNVSLQWCNQLDRVFGECYRTLSGGGLLFFSSFGPDTLKELRACWGTVDNYNHVNAFIDMHDIGDALIRAGFQSPVLDVEHFTLTYDDIDRLMRELKAIGAHNVTAGRPRGLTGKQRLAAVRRCYERYRQQGRLPASYEAIYGHAWVPANKATLVDGAVEIKISLKKMGRR